MLIFSCLQWWYRNGWKWRIAESGRILSGWAEYFSVESVLKTMFAPYKLTLTSEGGRGLSEKFQALLDNFISRLVGFMVRFSLLLAAAILFVGYGMLSLLMLVLWPLIPVLPLIAIVLVLTGVGA